MQRCVLLPIDGGRAVGTIRLLDAQFAVQCPAVGKRPGSVDGRRPCLRGASWDVFEDVPEVAGSRAPCPARARRGQNRGHSPPSTRSRAGPHPHLQRGGVCCPLFRGRSDLDPSLVPFFCRHACAVEGSPAPINLVCSTQLIQKHLMESLPYAGLLPVSQPAPAGHPTATAEFLR